MNSKYNLTTLRPVVSHLFHAASGGADVIFDWHAFEIPKGTCVVKHVSGTVIGVDGAAGNDDDFKLYFAKSINGVAPSSFGVPHAVNTATQTAAFRRNIIGFTYIDASAIDDGDSLVGYNVLGSRGEESIEQVNMMLQGDEFPYPGTTPGYQTIFIAAETSGAALDFGTEVDLNQVGHQAASVAAVQIVTTGTDPRKVFAPGDLIQGHTGTVTAEVVSVDSATSMTLKNISAQITQSEHLILQNPIVLNLGLEY
tara:strand:- start:37 stop:798 length:762 start_codon:yes stop_codon:yes gene_type:complete